MKRTLVFSVILLLPFISMACEPINNDGYYSSLENALNAETKEGTIEILLDKPEERIVVYHSKRDENDSGMIIVVTYDKKDGRYKRDIGKGEVAMFLGDSFGEYTPILTQQFVHPDTGDKYMNGFVGAENIKEVNIEFTIEEENDKTVRSINTPLENNNVFLINVGNLYTDAKEMQVELLNEKGEVLERH